MKINYNKKIRNARKMRGITQKELGKMLGYSEAHICHFEKGNRHITPEAVKKIEDILKINLEGLDDYYGENWETKADKLYEIIKYLFVTPDNYKEIEKIWNR
jgi:HTH-type transcriptional regulator/antitoxin HipB